MVDYKTILRLSDEKYSLRQISASVGHSHHKVKDVLELAHKNGITTPLDESVTNSELEKLLYPKRQTLADPTPSQTMSTFIANCQRKA